MLGLKFRGPPPKEKERPSSRRLDHSPDSSASASTSIAPRQRIKTGLEEHEVIEVSSDSDGDMPSTSKRKRKVVGRESEEEEEGRYEVGDPLRKRRRFGRDDNTHTIYVSDDDDDDRTISAHDDDEGLLKESKHDLSSRLTNGYKPSSRSSNRSSGDQRRAYWASKSGPGPTEIDD